VLAILEYITIVPEYENDGRSILIDDFQHGIKVPLLTLDELLNQNNLSRQKVGRRIILKWNVKEINIKLFFVHLKIHCKFLAIYYLNIMTDSKPKRKIREK
jgi:hypothetical protein